MLHQLPAELLEIILQLLRNRDLCALSTLCRSLHVVSLNTLFSRTKTFEPISTRRPLLRPGSGSPTRLFHRSQGFCITLESGENLNVLHGLRLALPYMLEKCQITSVVCAFNPPLRRTWAEIKNLGRFLSDSPIASFIENVVVDFALSFESAEEEDPMPEGVAVIKRFLQLFSSIKSGRTLPQCVSLTILNGIGFTGWDRWADWDVTVGNRKPSWLKNGSPAANLVQTFISTKVASVGRSKSSDLATTTEFGLRTLNLQCEFIFNLLFIDRASAMFRQYSDTLRSVSLDCSKLSDLGWTSLLARISLPHLRELYLGLSYIPPGPLINFLIRHRSIEILDIGSDLLQTSLWKRPPGLLPKLRTVKGTMDIVSYFFPSPKSTSKLQSVTLVVPTSRVHWPIFWFWLRTLCIIKPGLTYTLQIRIEGRQPIMWLRVPGPKREDVSCITCIEVHAWGMPALLETREIRSELASWLGAFPGASVVEIVGCIPMDEASWEDLCDLVKARVPKIRSFCVDGRNLDTS
ncbi:hypothetical protein AX16_001088 [Volvariella volvacea WC 439]|nr:hypothetical protein AX16_001088 [Volvariella volvacea WC 439]